MTAPYPEIAKNVKVEHLVALLKSESDDLKWRDKLKECRVGVKEDLVEDEVDVFHVVLSMLGVPENNCLHDDWDTDPKGFCRDWLWEEWYDIAMKDKPDFEGYISWVLEEVKTL